MIQAVRKDDDLLADIERAEPGAGACVWWLGHSGFLIKSRLGTVLIDPYLSDPITDQRSDTNSKYIRLTERCMDPGQLTGIDVIAVSHSHPGHLDPDTLQYLIDANPAVTLIVPAVSRSQVCESIGCEPYWPLGTDAGYTIRIGQIEVHGITAAHNDLPVQNDEKHPCLGYVVRLGDITIYHSGDTIWHDAIIGSLSRYRIDLAILPINGHGGDQIVPGNLSGGDAAKLAHTIDARLAVPCHYHMFTRNPDAPDAPDSFVQTCESLGQAYRVMRCGERIDVPIALSVS